MVGVFPKQPCSNAGRMSVILANASRYRHQRKKLKSLMLGELVAVLGYNRRYLALLLRSADRSVFAHYRTRVVADPRVSPVSRRGRKKTYTAELVPYLNAVWELANGIASVHLAALTKVTKPSVLNRSTHDAAHSQQHHFGQVEF